MIEPIAVLLVDRAGESCEAVERLLTSAPDDFSCTVYCVHSTAEADDLIQSMPVHAVLASLDLGEEPFAAIEHLSRRHAAIPVIALTTDEHAASGLDAIAHGACDYLGRSQLNLRTAAHVLRSAIARMRSQRRASGDNAFANSMPHPIVELSSDGTIVFANPAAEHMFPHLVEAGVQHPVLQGVFVVAEMLRGQEEKTIMRELRVDERCYAQELAVVSDTGNLRIFITDITERKRLDSLKDEFLSTVSHELRTPLTIVKGALSNVVDGIVGPLTEKQDYVLRTADRNCDRLARIINDLLDLSRLESGKAKLNRAAIDVRSLAKDAVENFAMIANENKISLRADLPAALPHTYADADMLMQVLTNLLDNAIRYAKHEVVLRVAQDETQQIVLSVIDDGRGMSEEDQKKLFNKFAQMHRIAGGAGYKGTGLGLSISREIIELHQGKIWAESAVDAGATFNIALPLYDAEQIFWEEFRASLSIGAEEDVAMTVCWVAIENAEDLIASHSPVRFGNFIATVEQELSTQALRRSDRVLHFGRNAFVVLLMADQAESARVVQRICTILQTCAEKLFADGPQATIALGKSYSATEGCDAERLLEQAQSDAESKGDVA